MWVLTLSAAFLCLGASGFGITTTIALLTLAFGFASMSEGPFWASAISVARSDAGAAGGLMNTIGNIGGIRAGAHAADRIALRLADRDVGGRAACSSPACSPGF